MGVTDLTPAKTERQMHMPTEVRNTAIFLHPYRSRMAPKNGQMMPANNVPVASFFSFSHKQQQSWSHGAAS